MLNKQTMSEVQEIEPPPPPSDIYRTLRPYRTGGSLTCQLLHGGFIQDFEGRVQLERLATSLTHEADLHGG